MDCEKEAEEYWCKVPAIGEFNVQSFVCYPSHEDDIIGTKATMAQGYALSGGGRGIQRVDVSNDNGETWHVAKLYQPSLTTSAHIWGWCLWTIQLEYKGYPIVCRAGKKFKVFFFFHCQFCIKDQLVNPSPSA